MQLDEATHQAHERYINHALCCGSCYPPTNRYCLVGSGLHDGYVAQYLMSLDIHARRTYLGKLELVDIARCERLKALMLQIREREKSGDDVGKTA